MEKYKKIYKGDVEITKIFVGNEKVWPSGPPITGLTITGETEVNNRSSLQLGIEYTPSYTTQQGVTWSSSDETKATVNSSGLVTAIAPGDVVITATSTFNGDISDTHNVTINNNLYAVIKPIQAYYLPEGVTYGLYEHNGWKYSVSDVYSPNNNNTFYCNDGSVAGKVLRLSDAEVKATLGSDIRTNNSGTGITDTLPVDKWYPDLFYNYYVFKPKNRSLPNPIPPYSANGFKISNMSAGTYKVKIWDANKYTVGEGSRYNINGISVTPFTGNRFTNSSPDVHGTSSTKPQLKEVTVTIGEGQNITILTHTGSPSGNDDFGASIAAIEIEKLS